MDSKEKLLIRVRLAIAIKKLIEKNRDSGKPGAISSLRKLAAASGVEYAIIQKITSGVKDPQFSTINAIAEGLDISVSALIHHYEQVTDFKVKQALLEKARKSRSKKA